MPQTHYAFKPLNVGRWIVWSFFALLLLAAPLVFTTERTRRRKAQAAGRSDTSRHD